MLNNAANKITAVRIALVPVFLALCYTGRMTWAFSVFVVACLSDLADGYIARNYHQVTQFGKFIDPLADKILVLSAMCFFVENRQMPGWIAAAVLFREFAVSGLRLVAVEQGRVIAAAWSGKIKTAATMICLCAMMLFGSHNVVNIISNLVILLTTVYSGVEYFLRNRDVFNTVKNNNNRRSS